MYSVLVILTIFSTAKGTGLGAHCMYDNECLTENSFCEGHSSCQCKVGFMASLDNDHCTATIGAYCTSKHDCSVTLPNSICVENQCVCDQGFTPDSHHLTCLSIVYQLGGDCQQDNQCQQFLGDNSHCQSSKCSCLPNFHFSHSHPSGEKCQRNKGLLEPCQKDGECFSSNSWNKSMSCIDGQCRCSPGYVQTNDMNCISSSYIASLNVAVFFATLLMSVISS